MANTKKVHTTGRFGSRYGVGIRKRVLKVEMKQKADHECPFCGFQKKIQRISKGIYVCRKCGSKFSGGTFTPSTLAGNIIKRMVHQKKFVPLTEELIKAEEAESLDVKATESPSEENPEGEQGHSRKDKGKKAKGE